MKKETKYFPVAAKVPRPTISGATRPDGVHLGPMAFPGLPWAPANGQPREQIRDHLRILFLIPFTNLYALEGLRNPRTESVLGKRMGDEISEALGRSSGRCRWEGRLEGFL